MDMVDSPYFGEILVARALSVDKGWAPAGHSRSALITGGLARERVKLQS
jgi:hypothetical protein